MAEKVDCVNQPFANGDLTTTREPANAMTARNCPEGTIRCLDNFGGPKENNPITGQKLNRDKAENRTLDRFSFKRNLKLA